MLNGGDAANWPSRETDRQTEVIRTLKNTQQTNQLYIHIQFDLATFSQSIKRRLVLLHFKSCPSEKLAEAAAIRLSSRSVSAMAFFFFFQYAVSLGMVAAFWGAHT